jgi:hypothetical protein
MSEVILPVTQKAYGWIRAKAQVMILISSAVADATNGLLREAVTI